MSLKFTITIVDICTQTIFINSVPVYNIEVIKQNPNNQIIQQFFSVQYDALLNFNVDCGKV